MHFCRACLCLSARCGWYAVCWQVEEEVVRRIVDLAAQSRKPRYLRLLHTLLCPEGQPVKRSQRIVLGCITENKSVLGDLKDKKADKLNDTYHIELIGLLGSAGLGDNATSELQVREILPLDVLMQLLNERDILHGQRDLHVNLLRVLCHSFLETLHPVREVKDNKRMRELIVGAPSSPHDPHLDCLHL